MRVLRKIMSEVGDIPVCEQSIEDKFEYKNLIYPGKKKHS